MRRIHLGNHCIGDLMDRIKVRARITTLGIDAGSHVEIDYTPAVQRKIEAGWLVELREYGARKDVSERD